MSTVSEVPADAVVRPGSLELLNRSGQTLRRIPLPAGEGSLGRDLICDVVLDDPYICPRHARLREVAAGLQIDDLGSVNGLSRGLGQPRQAQLVIPAGGTLRVGHSILRYRSAAAPLAPTLVDVARGGWLPAFERPAAITLFALAAPLLLLLRAYLETVSRTPGSKLLMAPVVALLLLICWAALWAFASRLLAYRWHFWTHLGLAAAAILAFLALDVGSAYLCFALDLDGVRDHFDSLGQTVVLGLLLYAHLRFVSAAPPQPLARAAGLIAVSILGVSFLGDLSGRDEFSSTPSFQATFKPPVFQITPGASLDTFLAEAGQLPAELERRTQAKR